jgi:hypothetical protein
MKFWLNFVLFLTQHLPWRAVPGSRKDRQVFLFFFAHFAALRENF